MRRFAPLLATAFALMLTPVSGVAFQSDAPATPLPVIDICGEYAGGATPEAESSVEVGDATFDLAYVDMTITSHQNAIIMLLIAEPRVEHPELVNFVNQSLIERRASIETLLAWRSEMHPNAAWVTVDQAMAVFDQVAMENPGRGGVAGAREIAAEPHIAELCADSEEPFDLLFIDHMLPHISGELLLSESASALATDPTLAAVAGELMGSSQYNLDALYAWRTLWYPDAEDAHSH
ncbi:MAG: DUF305 domain-containing protein [Thermomicrobiales bacterium]|nr:DUF305 domain-containing protein [Thermomicrobiales bacterium]